MLTEQIIVITGAYGGVGEAIAKDLASRGANLCLTGKDGNKLERLKLSILQKRKNTYPHQHIECYPADLKEPPCIDAMAKELTAVHPKIHALIHTAGIIFSDVQIAASPQLEKEQLQINTEAPSHLTQLLLPSLADCQSIIIFINSSAGIREKEGFGKYSKSKSQLKQDADDLRKTINPRGIRVTSVYLGRTATPMQKRLHRESNQPYHPENLIQPDDIAHLITLLLTLPKTSEVTDIHVRPTKK